MSAPSELQTVAYQLAELVEQVMFVGGMVRQLLVTDPAAGPARPTVDVDCVVNTSNWGDYEYFARQLRSHGFAECVDEGAPLCRWTVSEIRVDVMPVDPSILGFSNVWYPSALERTVPIATSHATIRIIDASHFCASKIESFLARGGGDYFHHDLEDLIAIVDGREELVAELSVGPQDVREFIAERVAAWLDLPAFMEALVGHLPGDAASQARLPLLVARLRQMAELGSKQPASSLSPHQSRLLPAVPVRSSNIVAVAYDEVTRVLTIEFHGGRTYAYDNVPQTIYQGFLAAASHGRYFHQWIRDRYGYRRLS